MTTATEKGMQMYDTVVVPLDGSRLAERAVAYARSLARQLVLVRAVEVHGGPFEEEGASERAAIASAENYLARTAGRRMFSGMAVRTEVYSSQAQKAILACAHSARAQLIVMATHGRTGVERAIFGSVAEAVLRGAHIPVLLVPQNCYRKWPVKDARVVVALDGSGFAAAAVQPALALAQSLRASLTLLYAVHVTDAVDTEFGLEPLITEDAEKYLRDIANRLRDSGATVVTEVEDGEPSKVITAAAADSRTAAVVLASHARRGVARAVLVNIPTSVIPRAQSPVLITRPTAAQAASQPAARGLRSYAFD